MRTHRLHADRIATGRPLRPRSPEFRKLLLRARRLWSGIALALRPRRIATARYTVPEPRAESTRGGQVVGGPVHRADRHHGGGVHRVGRLRSTALPAGHRGLRRACHHARRGRNHRPRRARRDRGRPSRHRGGHRGRPLRVVLVARGRSHEHRGRAHRAHRRGGKEAPHRPVAQRSGGHRPSPLRARRDGRGHRGAARPCRKRCSTLPNARPIP